MMRTWRICQSRHSAANPGISSCPPTTTRLATIVMEKRQLGKHTSIPKRDHDKVTANRNSPPYTQFRAIILILNTYTCNPPHPPPPHPESALCYFCIIIYIFFTYVHARFCLKRNFIFSFQVFRQRPISLIYIILSHRSHELKMIFVPAWSVFC